MGNTRAHVVALTSGAERALRDAGHEPDAVRREIASHPPIATEVEIAGAPAVRLRQRYLSAGADARPMWDVIG